MALVGARVAELAPVVALYVGSFAASLGAATCVLVYLPEDYLDRPEIPPLLPGRPRWMQTAARIGKNLLGAGLVATGAVLAVPGVPGSGMMTLLIGLILLDIPGKRPIERRILGSRRVLGPVNWVRARFGRAPLRIPPAQGGARPVTG
jgi:hypothetical protein